MDDDFNLLDLLMNAPEEFVQAHKSVDSEREPYVEEPQRSVMLPARYDWSSNNYYTVY